MQFIEKWKASIVPMLHQCTVSVTNNFQYFLLLAVEIDTLLRVEVQLEK
jgi:hypothetical protein